MSSLTNRVYTPVAIGLTLLIVIFFTRGVFATYTAETAELSESRAKLEKLTTEVKKLEQLQADFADPNKNTALKQQVARYTKAYNEADIMEAVMVTPPQVKTNRYGRYDLIIGNVSIDKGTRLPNGLSLGHVNLSLQSTNRATIIQYLSYLTKESPYAFTIDTFSLPLDTRPDATTPEPPVYSMNISLGLYYYDESK